MWVHEYVCVCVCVQIGKFIRLSARISKYAFTQPLHRRQGMAQGQFLSELKPVTFQFPFS